MPKTSGDRDSGFAGLDVNGAPNRLAAGMAQIASNTDHERQFMLRVRNGYSRTTLAKLAYPARALRFFVARDGTNQILMHLPLAGQLWGYPLPTELWAREPRVRTGRGWTFNPVTALAISDLGIVTLTWTNPTSEYWAGTKVLRRTDRYPTGPNDGAATTVYSGRLATANDTALAVGDTGYYSAYAYSRTSWAIPAQVSGTKVAYGEWGGSGTTVLWKESP